MNNHIYRRALNGLGMLPDQRPKLYQNPISSKDKEIAKDFMTVQQYSQLKELFKKAIDNGFDDVVYLFRVKKPHFALIGSAETIYKLSPRYVVEGKSSPFLKHRSEEEVIKIWNDILVGSRYQRNLISSLQDINEIKISVIPHPGGPDSAFFSAKHNDWYGGIGPIQIPELCKSLAKEKYSDANGPIIVRTPAQQFVAVTHGVNEGDIQRVIKCGGISWPSCAISQNLTQWINDQSITFYLDARILTRNLGYTSPPKDRQKGVHIAAWDNWTLRTSDYSSFMGWMFGGFEGLVPQAFLLAEYLSVGIDTTRFESVGMRDEYSDFTLKALVPSAYTWDQVDSALLAIKDAKKGKVRRTRFEKSFYKSNSYLELKVTDHIPLSDIPLCLIINSDKTAADVTKMKLQQAGFKGDFIIDTRVYSGLVNVIGSWANKNRRIIATLPSKSSGYEEKEKMTDSARSAKFISLPSGLIISDIEVTQHLYKSIMDKNPSNNKTSINNPVERVTWFEAIEFCNELTLKMNKRFGMNLTPAYVVNPKTGTVGWDRSANGWRLPTDAEWIYASDIESLRALFSIRLLDTVTFNKLDSIGWSYSNSSGVTQPVGLKEANKYGLFDMFGNVSEWIWDKDTKRRDPNDDFRFCRGSSVHESSMEFLQKYTMWSTNSTYFNGFRICRNGPGYIPVE